MGDLATSGRLLHHRCKADGRSVSQYVSGSASAETATARLTSPSSFATDHSAATDLRGSGITLLYARQFDPAQLASSLIL